MSFKTIDHLFFEPKKSELDVELLENFSPYLTMRSLTMLDHKTTGYVNNTLNRYFNILDSKEEKFRFFESLIPKSKKRRINYLKKQKKEIVEEDTLPEFYSRREFDKLKNFFK